MYINGQRVKELREELGLSVDELSEHLSIETPKLESYERGELWLEEDMFRLLTLSTIMPDSSYLLDGEYVDMFTGIEEEYGL